MSDQNSLKNVFPTAEDDVSAASLVVDSAQTSSSSYRLAYTDETFLLRDKLRPVRLQLELLKPDLLWHENAKQIRTDLSNF